MLPMMNIGASGMKAQELNLQNIASGLANINVIGAKATRLDYQEQCVQTIASAGAQTSNGVNAPAGLQTGSGVFLSGMTTNFSQGPIMPTSSPYEMAISGNGWFVIEKDGQQYLTRDGRFKPDLNGILVNSDGYPVVPNITIQPGSTNVSISANGMVTATAPGQTTVAQVGQIQIAMVANNSGLMKTGKGLYITSPVSGDIQQTNPGENGSGTLQSSALESSNASIVDLMVEMIAAQRGFEANSKSVQTGDEVLSITNNLKK